MARDPYWLFVYWEITDEALARAREQAGSPRSGCVLRVYDTTYQVFNGLNANSYFDIPVDRAANNYYIHVGRPASVFHVDFGVKNGDRFVPAVRSGAVETPRDSVSSEPGSEWRTVDPDWSYRPYRHRYVPKPVVLGAGGGGGAATFGIPQGDLDRFLGALVGEGWTRTEWSITEMGGRLVRWVRWAGPWKSEHWAWSLVGPFSFARVEVTMQAERRVVRFEQGERVVFGPWRVTITGIETGGGRRVLDQWAMRASWLTEEGSVKVFSDVTVYRIMQGYRAWVIPMGSEVRLAREAWSSEALRVGASEWRWIGGSEIWLGGASETFFRGASETLFLGASETVLLGASETLFAGASGWLFMGASGAMGSSEVLLGGASEKLQAGASEAPYLGASEARP
jgi:hypothetical protein